LSQKPENGVSSESNPCRPSHVAIVMDGNGRWAQKRKLPRHAGHPAGVESVREIVEVAVARGIKVLTLFAFSSENWNRPPTEVSLIMDLFMRALQREAKRLHRNNVRLSIIGNREALSKKLQQRIDKVEEITAGNSGLVLQVAANYGGRWDIAQATKALAKEVASGELDPDSITEEHISAKLSFSDLPDPDLFIRTGGEQRISNFMLWQSAYSEFYFSDELWPDFREAAFDRALDAYANRQRRFGLTGEQIIERGSTTPSC
jgi:undecaprenyl diphosphate synthase